MAARARAVEAGPHEVVGVRSSAVEGRTRRGAGEDESAVARGRRERAAVFNEEEKEGIDLRLALAVIYLGDLLPVPATSRE